LGLDIDLNDPLMLARTTIFFPTRRATRGFRSVLAQVIGGNATLLPRLIPIGDVDDAETGIALAGLEADIQPAIEPLRRRMLLTHLVSAWAKAANRDVLRLPGDQPLMPQTTGDAFALSRELASLIDETCIEGIALDQLGDLDANRFDGLWDLNVRFLGIAAKAWPELLAERGLIDAAERRNQLIARTCALLDQDSGKGFPGGPVIAAGSTGSIPATARLLAAIAVHPQGAVVLPDLDKGLDDASWKAVEAEADGAEAAHPQSIMTQLLQRIGAVRNQVQSLSGAQLPGRSARRYILREALRPVSTTDQWATLTQRIPVETFDLAFATATIIDARNERDEALAIAVILRGALEDENCNAALITPDRALATRVAAELQRWNITVDDSAGVAIARTPAGALASLVLACLTSDFAAGPVLAVLAHPSVSLGLTSGDIATAAHVLEIGALRGVALKSGLPNLIAAIATIPERQTEIRHPPQARRRITAEDIALCSTAIQCLQSAFKPLTDAVAGAPRHILKIAALAQPHRQVLVSLTDRGDSSSTFWTDEAGQALSALLDNIHMTCNESVDGEPADYADVFTELARETMVRQAWKGHPRVKILGLLEARLLDANLVVLGGLVETSWPPAIDTGAFLNRAMRAQLGLSSPERRIGQTAHDFAQAFASQQIVLSKARKVASQDTIPSRFWQRLKAISPPQCWDSAIGRGDKILAQARSLDTPVAAVRIPRPAPIVPLRLQPLRYSATAIETLYRDPYQVFARRILKLDELEPLATRIDARDRGTIIHAIMEQFAQAHPAAMPADPEAALAKIARAAFAPFADAIDVAMFWWPQWCRMQPFVIRWEHERRSGLQSILTEETVTGTFTLADGSSFHVSSRVDRIEVMHDASIRLIDFKTGAPPSARQIAAGLAAQLLIGVALATRNGFREIGPRKVSQAAYVRLNAGKHVERFPPEKTMGPLETAAQDHMARLCILLDEYRQGRRGFTSRIVPLKADFNGPYDHLARAAEWSLAGDGDDDGDNDLGDVI
jgi:ATP-dependent helicase/nuclease subunit B